MKPRTGRLACSMILLAGIACFGSYAEDKMVLNWSKYGKLNVAVTFSEESLSDSTRLSLVESKYHYLVTPTYDFPVFQFAGGPVTIDYQSCIPSSVPADFVSAYCVFPILGSAEKQGHFGWSGYADYRKNLQASASRHNINIDSDDLAFNRWTILQSVWYLMISRWIGRTTNVEGIQMGGGVLWLPGFHNDTAVKENYAMASTAEGLLQIKYEGIATADDVRQTLYIGDGSKPVPTCIFSCDLVTEASTLVPHSCNIHISSHMNGYNGSNLVINYNIAIVVIPVQDQE